MNSHANGRSATSPKRLSLGDGEVCRYGPGYRALAYGAVGVPALAVCAYGWTFFTTGGADFNPGACMAIVAGLGAALNTAPELLSELCLTEEGLRKDSPLRTETMVPFDEVRRVFIGGATVELYVGSDDQPALTFSRKVRGSDHLIEKLVGRLPARAQVDHPSGELSEWIGDRSAAV